jgi:hypothetical protein
VLTYDMKRKNCVGQGWSARGTKGPRARVKLYLWDTCMGSIQGCVWSADGDKWDDERGGRAGGETDP